MVTTQLPADAGLRGAVVGNTRLSSINGDEGKLIYRGLDIKDLAQRSTFEEVAYLLWHGALPTAANLAAFRAELAAQRSLPQVILDLLKSMPRDAVPMDVLRTAVSALGVFDPDADDHSRDATLARAVRLTAAFPAILAAHYRLSHALPAIAPQPEHDTATSFLAMMFGREPSPLAVRVLDVSLILHADHGMNASTFSAIVTAATLSDIYSAITSAVGTLKGPLHGGANEGVIDNLLEIGDVDRVEAWVAAKFAAHEKVMGFGHAVYKAYDPRAAELKAMAKAVGAAAGSTKWFEMTEAMERAVWNQKGLYPNVDLYSAALYHTLGIPTAYFTPVFAMSRIVGWCAHVLEQYADNKLIRPRAQYVGARGVDYTPIADRPTDIAL
jgi:citrate synthase